MSDVAVALLLVVTGYLVGTVPTAVVVGRSVGHDPTREGSRNPGASNVFRTAGRRAGALVLAGDLLKGAVAAGAGWWAGDHLLGLLCGCAAVVGHVAPVWRLRRGGKGVATAAGVVLVLFPLHGLAAALCWAVVVRWTNTAAVGSLVLAAGLPVSLAVTGVPGVELGLLVGLTALIMVRHRSNLDRLWHGRERPLQAGRP